jgi:hypothetical protein
MARRTLATSSAGPICTFQSPIDRPCRSSGGNADLAEYWLTCVCASMNPAWTMAPWASSIRRAW